ELFFTPTVVPVTLTEKLTLLPAAREPPARLTVPEPAAAVTVPPPRLPPMSVKPLGLATTRPAGKLSVNDRPVRLAGLPAGLVMVKVRLVVALSGRLATPNAVPRDGGATTVRVKLWVASG